MPDAHSRPGSLFRQLAQGLRRELGKFGRWVMYGAALALGTAIVGLVVGVVLAGNPFGGEGSLPSPPTPTSVARATELSPTTLPSPVASATPCLAVLPEPTLVRDEILQISEDGVLLRTAASLGAPAILWLRKGQQVRVVDPAAVLGSDCSVFIQVQLIGEIDQGWIVAAYAAPVISDQGTPVTGK